MTGENDDLDFVQLGEETVSLAQLAGLSFDQFQEKRGFDWPICTCLWEVVTDNEHEPPKFVVVDNSKGGKSLTAQFNLKCLEVLGLNEVTAKECGINSKDELIGRFHRETIFITTMESFDYLKAFVVDIGSRTSGNMPDQLLATVGLRFTAPMQWRRDKDDKDKIYRSLNRNRVKAQVQKAA